MSTADPAGPRPRASGDADEVALVAELGRRSGACWLRRPGEQARLAWHVWHDDALCLVSGGDEQRLPDLDDGGLVEVLMRSPDTGGLASTWAGRVSVVRPGDEAWPGTVAALVAGRLNLRDPLEAPERWARDSTVHRITPTHEAVG